MIIFIAIKMNRKNKYKINSKIKYVKKINSKFNYLFRQKQNDKLDFTSALDDDHVIMNHNYKILEVINIEFHVYQVTGRVIRQVIFMMIN